MGGFDADRAESIIERVDSGFTFLGWQSLSHHQVDY